MAHLSNTIFNKNLNKLSGFGYFRSLFLLISILIRITIFFCLKKTQLHNCLILKKKLPFTRKIRVADEVKEKLENTVSSF